MRNSGWLARPQILTEKLAERKFPDHYLKPIHMVVMEGSADDIEKISCGHSRHRSKEIHSL